VLVKDLDIFGCGLDEGSPETGYNVIHLIGILQNGEEIIVGKGFQDTANSELGYVMPETSHRTRTIQQDNNIL